MRPGHRPAREPTPPGRPCTLTPALPLRRACRALLKEKGPQYQVCWQDSTGQIAAHHAAYFKQHECLKLLLESCCAEDQVFTANVHQRLPLHEAGDQWVSADDKKDYKPSIECARLLLAVGRCEEQLTSPDKNHQTALFLARSSQEFVQAGLDRISEAYHPWAQRKANSSGIKKREADEAITICMSQSCQTVFDFNNKRHQCQRCGNTYCGECR